MSWGCCCWSHIATHETWRRTWTERCTRPSGRWRSRNSRMTSRPCEKNCSYWWARRMMWCEHGKKTTVKIWYQLWGLSTSPPTAFTIPQKVKIKTSLNAAPHKSILCLSKRNSGQDQFKNKKVDESVQTLTTHCWKKFARRNNFSADNLIDSSMCLFSWIVFFFFLFYSVVVLDLL